MARKSTWIAGALALGLSGWMASGMLAEDEVPGPAETARAEPEPVLVEVMSSRAEPVQRTVLVQGDAQAWRSARVRSEASGRIATIAVEEGEAVEAGQPMMTLALEDRESRLAEAEALLAQRLEDHEAGLQLQEKGYATDERIRELRTALEQARAQVAEIEAEVEDTTIAAPFSGIVNELHRRLGEVVTAGEEVATLIDNSPLRVEVRIPQQDIARIETGAPAQIAFATGAREAGRVCVISVAADAETRTFRVEVRTPNADDRVPSGISAEVRIPTGEIDAHFLTPAILSLNDDGRLGVKTVTEEGAVAFDPVEIVQARADGIWVTGLPAQANVITVGQGFVRAGEAVRVAPVGAAAPDAGSTPPAPAAEAASSPADADLSPPDPAICDRPRPDGAGTEGPVAEADSPAAEATE